VVVYFSNYHEVTFENVLILHFIMPFDKQNKQIYVERLLILSTRGVTNQNSIAEEIKSRLRSGNACYHLVQNLLSSRLLSKNLKI